MKITRIEAQNFLSIGVPGLLLPDLEDYTIIVGPNASGKTTLFRALEFVGGVFTRTVLTPEPFRHNFDPAAEPILKIGVKFSEEERVLLADLAVAAAKTEARFASKPDIDNNVAREIAGELLHYLRGPFAELFSEKTYFHVRGQDKRMNPLNYFIEFVTTDGSIFLTHNGLTRSNLLVTGWQQINLGEALVKELEAIYPGILGIGAAKKPLTVAQMSDFGEKVGIGWLLARFHSNDPYPAIMSSLGVNFNQYDGQPGTAGSDIAKIRTYLERRSYALGGIDLINLAAQIFQYSLARLSDARSAPTSNPLPPISKIDPETSLVDGSSVADSLFRLKNSPLPAERGRFRILAEAFREFFNFDVDVVVETHSVQPGAITSSSGALPLAWVDGKVAVQPEPKPVDVNVASLRWSDEKTEFPLGVAAAGLYEALLVLFTAICRENSIVLLDEPALNLHPTKQRALVDLISKVSPELGNQVFLVTHSPNLVNAREGLSVIRFDSKGGDTVTYRLLPTADETADRVIRTLERFPRLVAALFAKKVVLVEGGGEEAALPVWFEKLESGSDLPSRGIEFIDVGGVKGFDAHVRVLQAWGVPYRIVADGGSSIVLTKFPGVSHSFPQADFGVLLDTECHEDYVAVVAEVLVRKPGHSPVIAREVAFRCAPPPTVVGIWDFLKAWINSA
ncbi:MAG: AAA family ATPase [Thermoplasmata archaeon]